MKYVYAVYKGCKFEGGGVRSIWDSPALAMQEANSVYELAAAQAKEIWKDKDESEFHWNQEQRNEHWSEDLIGSWCNAIDIIQVWRYKLNQGENDERSVATEVQSGN